MQQLSLKKKLLFSAIVVALFFVIIEIGLRIGIRILDKINTENTVTNLFDTYERFDSDYIIGLKENFRELDSQGNIALQINSHGFRGPEFEAKKSAGTQRIFIAGDSVVFGIRPESCPYPAQLGALFQSKNMPHIEVINAGIEGTNSTQMLQRLKKDILQYDPDTLLLAVGWNDIYTGIPGRFQGLWRFFNNFYTIKTYRRILFTKIKPALSEITESTTESNSEQTLRYRNFVPEAYIANIRSMREVAQQHHFQLVLVTLPHILGPNISEHALKIIHYPHFTNDIKIIEILADRYNDTLRKLAQELQLPLIDLERHIEALPNKEPYFTDTIHTTCEGNTIIANFLYQELLRQELTKAL
ncbi:hypothetical protein COV82_05145 [Candidatus Peregrinibacteria bacterium CG11_big_fil_rev_8_21_14_0_20_46_8]|nr:MAG: hypothetical protein COV82_05145 [Candidatus Peregrinibacteria bacterium CG11_big_fil_rev_8_21_14_0_20_46_8]